jgi:hypothetical protein
VGLRGVVGDISVTVGESNFWARQRSRRFICRLAQLVFLLISIGLSTTADSAVDWHASTRERSYELASPGSAVALRDARYFRVQCQ